MTEEREVRWRLAKGRGGSQCGELGRRGQPIQFGPADSAALDVDCDGLIVAAGRWALEKAEQPVEVGAGVDGHGRAPSPDSTKRGMK